MSRAAQSRKQDTKNCSIDRIHFPLIHYDRVLVNIPFCDGLHFINRPLLSHIVEFLNSLSILRISGRVSSLVCSVKNKTRVSGCTCVYPQTAVIFSFAARSFGCACLRPPSLSTLPATFAVERRQFSRSRVASLVLLSFWRHGRDKVK